MDGEVPYEINEIIKILKNNETELCTADDATFRRGVLRMTKALALGTYYNFKELCSLRKELKWHKYLLCTILVLLLSELAKTCFV